MENPDRRRYLRYEILDYGRVRGEGFEANAVVVDIGLGGMQVRSRTSLPVGTVCFIDVGRGDEECLRLRAEIRYCSRVGSTDLFATGMKFLPETHGERMAIAEFVHQVFQRQCDMMVL